MWISKEKYEQLEKRLTELEQRTRNARIDLEFQVFKPVPEPWLSMHATSMYHLSPSQIISVKTVIERILEKIGMELVYVEGHPTKVEMRKKAKAAA